MDMLVQFGGGKMIKYFEGTVFNSGACTLVNAVNTVGVMGAGIALEFRLRYPRMYYDYKKKCEEGKLVVEKVDYFNVDSNIIIVNFPTKVHFKYPSKLIWIEKGLQYFVETYKEHSIKSIAFPKLGASNGGLEWERVKVVMERYLSNLDIEVIICLDEKKNAEGIEGEMLKRLNHIDINDLSNEVKLSKKQIEIIAKNLPLNRFWELSKLESIGIKTYENIFKFFYEELKNGCQIDYKQQSLFEGN